MAQASVETPETANSADDMLSRLAGEEIDRLLAEAEQEKTAPKPAAAVEEPAPVNAEMIDNAALPVAQEAALAAEDAAPAGDIAAVDKEAMSADLDQLFNELTSDAATDKPLIKSPEPPVESTAPAPVSNAEQAASNQERAALTQPIPEAVEEPDEEPVPVYLKPLALLNSPLNLVPESARELVGKFAIITFMNSVALLAYLLLFR